MLMPGVGSVSGVVHLAARKPYIIAIIIALLTVVGVEAVPWGQASITQWVTIHQTKR